MGFGWQINSTDLSTSVALTCYDMQHWKIVRDIHMSSARKRREQGLEPLADTTDNSMTSHNLQQQQDNSDSPQD